ncbi:MAG TPA: erythromycin esterase family protein, partial [Enhygromyxa sp.]|nr:erythromycin esterase family protein [Enhygromyxa sp.]
MPHQLTRSVRPLDGGARQFDPILERIGDASTVLIGEASHGTHEFYEARAALTRQLIADRGFAAVVAEADWPDAYRVNRFVRGEGDDHSAYDALGDFERFPTWMWRNHVVEDFATWLRYRNDNHRREDRAGFYGMDLYSLYRSIEKVLEFLDEADPSAAERARERYTCFDSFEGRAELYARAAGLGLHPGCERVAVAQLLDMRRRAELHLRDDGLAAIDRQFFAEQNARLVREAERYYRSMFGGRVTSWNLRDRHMMATCEALREHLAIHGAGDKLVIWAHNSHVGDARATDWRRQNQLNLGQLMRERHGEQDVVIIGFSTHTGTVTAASEWGGPARLAEVRPSLRGSWERTLHEVGEPRFCLIAREAEELLDEERLTRAIGV